MEITLTLPDEWVAKAGRLAARSGRGVEDVLRDTLSLSFGGASSELVLGGSVPWKERSDDEVLRLCELRLTSSEDEMLTILLEKQRVGTLSGEERTNLTALMLRYEEGLLLKAEAMREGISRGLTPPLEGS